MKIHILEQDGLSVFVYSFEWMDSRMYMICDGDEIFVVDPCVDEELLRDAGLAKRATVFLTHEHYDHISGVNWLKEHFSCSVYAGEICAGRITSERDNLSSRFPLIFLTDREKYHYIRDHFSLPYTCEAENRFKGKGEMMWKGHLVELYEVGGHSPGSCLIMFDRKLLFGGDNILDNGRELWGTDGNPIHYREKVLPMLGMFDPHITVLPGHGEKNQLGYFFKALTERY